MKLSLKIVLFVFFYCICNTSTKSIFEQIFHTPYNAFNAFLNFIFRIEPCWCFFRFSYILPTFCYSRKSLPQSSWLLACVAEAKLKQCFIFLLLSYLSGSLHSFFLRKQFIYILNISLVKICLTVSKTSKNLPFDGLDGMIDWCYHMFVCPMKMFPGLILIETNWFKIRAVIELDCSNQK